MDEELEVLMSGNGLGNFRSYPNSDSFAMELIRTDRHDRFIAFWGFNGLADLKSLFL
jgi:hypothetical protein